MPVFIYEKDAFRKIVCVEGPEYPHNQRNFGICSFRAFKNKWRRLYKADERLIDFRPVFGINVKGNGAIYGFGGWNRYVVLNTGEIMLLGPSVELPEDIVKARQVGFRIFAQDLTKKERSYSNNGFSAGMRALIKKFLRFLHIF